MNKTIYLMDTNVTCKNSNNPKKYIARSYKHDGEIQYFDEDDPKDGFSDIIKDLQIRKDVMLYTSQKRMKATLEFLNELKFSVQNTILTLTFKDEKNKWNKVIYEF